jgi:hypothetical protein
MKNQNESSALHEKKDYTEEILLIAGGLILLAGVIFLFVQSDIGRTILVIGQTISRLQFI